MSIPEIPIAPFVGVLILGYVSGPSGVRISAWEDTRTGMRWSVDQSSGLVVPFPAEEQPKSVPESPSALRIDP